MNDKKIESKRYDTFASEAIASGKYISNYELPKYLQPPYDFYKELLKKNDKKLRVLEIGAGMGENTQFLLELGFIVCATDISPISVEVMKSRFSNYNKFSSIEADMEKLPFTDASFDIVCSAGSLSYGDNFIVMNEIYRVLKPKGRMISVDSLDNNPIYRFNRFVHFIRGNRSISTLKRMPNVNLINNYIDKFEYSEVKYFGSITWLLPILSKILNDKKTTIVSNYFDKVINTKKSAFKFTMLLTKK